MNSAGTRVVEGHRSAEGPRASIDALTGIRFFAAAAVVLFHYRGELETLFPSLRSLSVFSNAGFLGVDLFFVLSGFILTYNYLPTFERWDRRAYMRFLGLRLARLYPLHLFTLGVLGVLLGVAASRGVMPRSEGFSLGSLLQNLLLVQAWFSTAHTWNGPAWSISAEWFAYLAFPLVALALNRVRTPRAAVLGAALSFAGMLLAFACLGFPHLPLLQIGGEFLAGAFLGRLHLLGSRPSRAWDRLSLLTVLALGGLVWGLTAAHVHLMLVAPMFGLLIMAVAQARGRLAAWLGTPRLVFWGEASYALYMTHEVVHLVGLKTLPMASFATEPTVIRLAVALGYGGVILGCAALTYRLVERPSRRFLRRHLLHSAR